MGISLQQGDCAGSGQPGDPGVWMLTPNGWEQCRGAQHIAQGIEIDKQDIGVRRGILVTPIARPAQPAGAIPREETAIGLPVVHATDR